MSKTPLLHWLSRCFRSALEQVSITTLQEKPISRRDFLKGSLGLLGLGLGTGVLLQQNALSDRRSSLSPHFQTDSPYSDNNSDHTVIIVGGGLAGLVTAYRLSQQGILCELFEASPRLGGRMFTQENFNSDGMFVELGGELIDSNHSELIALCQELQVAVERFDSEAAVSGLQAAIYFSEGKVRSDKEVIEAFQPLALQLQKDIHRCFPDGIVQIPTYKMPFNTTWLDRMSLEDYLNAQTRTMPTESHWLLQLIKVAYTGEYGLDPHEQSALNLLTLIGVDSKNDLTLFGSSDEAMRVQGGNRQLIQALAKALEKNRVPIHTGAPLLEIQGLKSKSSRNRLRLTFAGKTASFQKSVRDAHQVVLALPFSVLRHISGVMTLDLTPRQKQCIMEWGYGTNSKQMVGFQERFWRQKNPNISANTGEMFTDLPSQCYWETSRLQHGKAGILTNFTGGETARNMDSNQWKQVLKDLDQVYGEQLATSQFDRKQAFFNWSRNPWSRGGYTCPKPGQYTTLMGVAQESALGERLFFVGEHCSVMWSGYMNGAVQSANSVANRISANYSGGLSKGNPDDDWFSF